jgi:photosystem II stability/assembly factor-like uncharacterized protein
VTPSLVNAGSAHGKIYRSSDCGNAFEVSQVGFRKYTHVHFTSAASGWISGIGGYMLHTTDAGATWKKFL